MSENGSIDPSAAMGAVRLAVADLDGVRDFYRDAIGLTELEPADGIVRLGTDGSREALVELVGEPDAPPVPAGRAASSISPSSSPAGRTWRGRCSASPRPAGG